VLVLLPSGSEENSVFLSGWARCVGGAFGMYHDLSVSEHYYVILENPLNMDLVKLLTQYVSARLGRITWCTD
jgi:hypothetical protein